MLEVLYRIYEVSDKVGEWNNSGCAAVAGVLSISKMCNVELVMDCVICESREHFKDIIRDTYGENIKFRYSKNLPVGTLYCVIIGEHCYNTDRYFDRKEYDCEYCNKHIVTYRPDGVTLTDYDIRHSLFSKEEFFGKNFCSDRCKQKYIEYQQKVLHPDEDSEFFVTKDMFQDSRILGYIYKITKRTTGEFYVGQSAYLPMFRWAQHLKTQRFPLFCIEDYMFEVLEVVDTYSGDDLLEREKYWIRQAYSENPDKSLNIAGTAGI